MRLPGLPLLLSLYCMSLPGAELKLPSPDGSMVLALSDSAGLSGTVSRGGTTVARLPQMGLRLLDGTFLGGAGARIAGSKSVTHHGRLTSALWDSAELPDHWNGCTVRLESGGRRLELLLRVYNGGVAWQWHLESEGAEGMEYETTQLQLPLATNYRWEDSPESGYKSATHYSRFNTLTPLLCWGGGVWQCVGEACNEGIASRLRLEVNKSVVGFGQRVGKSGGGFRTPWRYVLTATTAAELAALNWVARSLCPTPAGNFDWVKPGLCMRHLQEGHTGFDTDSVCRTIDFAAQAGIDHVLLDAGWYGLGYHEEGNPRSNPLAPVKGLDIERVVQYGKTQGVGIFLYVNRIAWECFRPTEILDTYSRTGVAGVKLGFVDGSSQEGLQRVYSIVRMAAKRRLMVNVHDSMRPTGLARTWPNLLTVEGVRGNEHVDNPTSHTTTLPFSRALCGPMDYTICYPTPGNAALKPLPGSAGHQMALMVLLFSPLQHVLWYGRAWEYEGGQGTGNKEQGTSQGSVLELLRGLPTVWDETRWLGGSPGEWAAVARRRGENWWVAVANGPEARQVTVALPAAPKTGEIPHIQTYGDLDRAPTLPDEGTLTVNIPPNGGFVLTY